MTSGTGCITVKWISLKNKACHRTRAFTCAQPTNDTPGIDAIYESLIPVLSSIWLLWCNQIRGVKQPVIYLWLVINLAVTNVINDPMKLWLALCYLHFQMIWQANLQNIVKSFLFQKFNNWNMIAVFTLPYPYARNTAHYLSPTLISTKTSRKEWGNYHLQYQSKSELSLTEVCPAFNVISIGVTVPHKDLSCLDSENSSILFPYKSKN